MIPDRDYSAMPPDKISAADTSDWIAVLPLGAHEQHGPHLPFETDAIIAGGMADRLSDALVDDLPVTFLPVEPVGYSIEHMDHKGTKSLPYDEAVDRWILIGEKLARQGIRKLVLLNAHGGNSPLMTIVATELRVRFDMLCVVTSWTRFLLPGDYLTQEEKSFGIHGGHIETSVMLVLAPDMVDVSRAKNFSSLQQELERDATHLRAYGPHAFGWKMSDLNQQGVAGNASQSSIEAGEAFISQAVAGLAELIGDVHRFDLKIFSK